MALEILPRRAGGAAENMALDFLLLQRYPLSPGPRRAGPETGAPRFRPYGWRGPAFTFGISQKIALVRAALPAGLTVDLCRRPTGGGLVDHRHDWTYALVIPRGHVLEAERAAQSYRAVHESLAAALRAQGVPCSAKASPGETADRPTEAPARAAVCFQRAEPFDVVHELSGAKIAGAAQKRNKRGLLFQGSIWRPATGVPVDWEKFHDDFAAQLAALLGVPAEPVPWPEFDDEEVSGLTEQYSAPEWLEYR